MAKSTEAFLRKTAFCACPKGAGEENGRCTAQYIDFPQQFYYYSARF